MKRDRCTIGFKTVVSGLAMYFLILNWLSGSYAQTSGISYEELQRKYIPQSRPEETVRMELRLLAEGMYCYVLPLFDSEWRKRGRQILRSAHYRDTAKKAGILFKVYTEGNYAIVYYPDNESEGPDFLYHDSSGWVLDRTAVWDYIHYNDSNIVWFAYDGDYPYLEMLKRIFPLERVRLNNGVMAYQIKE